MNHQDPNDENKENIKKRKITSNVKGAKSRMAAADISSNEEKLDEITLDIDCIEETYDNLSLSDLLAFGQKWKCMHPVVGHILQQTYPGVEIQWKSGSGVSINNVPINYFQKFVRKIRIKGNDALQDFNRFQTEFHRLRRLDLMQMDLIVDDIEHLKGIFSSVEHLTISNCTLDGNVHDSIFALCPKLKRFSVSAGKSGNNILIGSENGWLHHNYATLEYFEIDTDNIRLKIDELKTFLQLNRNIQDLSVPDRFLKTNKHALIDGSVKLNNLAISIEFGSFDTELFELLKSLHEHGVYKRLKLYFSCAKFKQKYIGRLATLNVLVKLEVACIDSLRLSQLSSIEELYVGESGDIEDLADLPANLTKLERIEFFSAFADDILPFVRESVQVKHIKVSDFKNGSHFSEADNCIDLTALNTERERLIGAQKITIYLAEDIYLATKRAFKQTDFNLIRLMREESYER